MRGVAELVAKLRQKAAKARDDEGEVIVGYTASYAVYVHEDLEARHKEGKQAKFLSEPANYLRSEMAFIVRSAMRAGRTLLQALLLAGLRLQRESQQLVPVDTGNLRASAFTRLVKK